MYEINEKLSSDGNPVILINAKSVSSAPSQDELPSFYEYETKYKGTDLTAITREEPIEVVVLGGNAFMKEIKFIIIDGHHRFYSAMQKNIDIFVELTNENVEEEDLTWEDIIVN